MADYPTKAEFKTIEDWSDFKNFGELMDFVQDIWWNSEWGWTQRGKRVIKYSVSTGGWSGNESIIRAMRDNYMFWSMCWVSSRRGGHYKFEIRPIKQSPAGTPAQQKDTK